MSRREMLLASMGGLAAGMTIPVLAHGGVVADPGASVQRRRTAKLALPRAGDFSSSALVGVYDPVPDDQVHRKGYFGLGLDAAWPYGGLETESGKRYLLLRKITYQTTNYLFIQVDGANSVEIDRRCFEKCQFGGTVKRRFENGYDVYDGKLAPMPGMPAFQLRVGHQDFSWVEDGVLSISGKRFAPAWHVYVPWRESSGEAGGCYYTSACWTAEGEIFGEKARGFFILDHDYLPAGVDWNDDSNLVWSRLQQTWGVFATEWDDGTIEWGHIAKGWGDFQFGSVSSNREDLSLFSQDVKADLQLTADGWCDRIEFSFDRSEREKWEFVTAPNGRFVEASGLFSALNRTDWRGHSGLMRRVGEKRKVVRHIAWQEVFPQRFGWKAP